MDSNDVAAAKACCADLYQSDLAKMILGDTRHPGGLRLTNRLGQLMSLKPDDWVVDLASGNGASAIALSRVFRCKVVGIEYGRAATLEAVSAATGAAVPARAWFTQADAEQPPLRARSFDGVFIECSLSLFPNKQQAVTEAVNLLKPGGRLGITDVTLTPGTLPAELTGSLGQMLCLTDALDVDGYSRLMKNAGLKNLYTENASGYLLELLGEVKAGLQAFSIWREGLNQAPDILADEGLLLGVPWMDLASSLEKMVHEGMLGYRVYVGEQP